MLRYMKPEAKVVIFDNTDIITASYKDLINSGCSERLAMAYCSNMGDSEKANECGWGGLTCTQAAALGDVFCTFLLWNNQQECNVETQTFHNAQPFDPIEFEDEEDNW